MARVAATRLETLFRGTNLLGSIMFAKVYSWFDRGGDAGGLLSPDIAVGGTNPTIVSDPGRWIINNRGQVVAANEHCWGKQGIWNTVTNVCLRSEAMTDAVWTKSNWAAAASAEAPPFAGSGVSELTATSGIGVDKAVYQVIIATAATYGLCFFFIKGHGDYANNRRVQLYLQDLTAGAARADITFEIDATTKVVTLVATEAGAGICLDAGNGWYCIAAWATAGVVNGNVHMSYLGSEFGAFSFDIGEQLLVTCAQIQFGDYQLGPYIPTSGAAVIRNPDIIQDSSISAELAACGSSAGWEAGTFRFRGNYAFVQVFTSIYQSAANRFHAYAWCDLFRFFYCVGGAAVASITRPLLAGETLCRYVCSWDIDWFRMALNNNCAAGDNTGALIPTPTLLALTENSSPSTEGPRSFSNTILIGKGRLNGISGIAGDPLTGDALVVDQALQVLAGG